VNYSRVRWCACVCHTADDELVAVVERAEPLVELEGVLHPAEAGEVARVQQDVVICAAGKRQPSCVPTWLSVAILCPSSRTALKLKLKL
jgi:hypothetical protein